MKLIKLIFAMSVGVFVSWTITSCENQDNEFPDYEGGTSVYFATQYPVRTLVMGEDEYEGNSSTIADSKMIPMFRISSHQLNSTGT